MDSLTDQQLLRDYAERQSESAFAELVRRHIDLVHSAALRMVCDAHLAQDVTQSAFVALAQNARQLTDRPVLSGWLHRTARNLAANVVRSDVRRRAREQEAAAMNELLSAEPEAAWEKIAPHLDAALDDLSEPDRDALMLRYFERKSAHDIAQRFGISDDAAQKRVSRAVERLREFFSKRGVAIGAGGLVVAVSANAVQAAPVALAATISQAAILAGTTVHTSSALAATKLIAMTTMQKVLVTATVTALIGAGIYQAHQTARLHQQIHALGDQQTPLTAQIQQLQHDLSDAADRLAALQAENSQLKSNQNTAELMQLRGEVGRLREANNQFSSATNDARGGMIRSWLERRDKLKQLVEQYPDKSIPEFQLLSEQQWLNAAMNAKFDTDTNILRDLADLRHTAENNLVSQMHEALQKYIKDKNGQFPTDLAELQPYFESPLDAAILNRWEIVPQSTLPNQSMGGDWVITEKSPIDSFDNRWAIGPSGYGNASYQSAEVNNAIELLNPALKAYAAANNGKQPADPADLLPYLTTPEQQAAYQKLLQNRGH